MIDIENDVFDYVAKGLREAHSGLFVSGDYVSQVPRFPAVTVIEAENHVYLPARADRIENAANVMYEVNVYSNKPADRKSEAKKIANTVDELFESLGFTRTFRDQVPNFSDARVCRILCRYEAVVGRNDNGTFLVYFN